MSIIDEIRQLQTKKDSYDRTLEEDESRLQTLREKIEGLSHEVKRLEEEMAALKQSQAEEKTIVLSASENTSSFSGRMLKAACYTSAIAALITLISKSSPLDFSHFSMAKYFHSPFLNENKKAQFAPSLTSSANDADLQKGSAASNTPTLAKTKRCREEREQVVANTPKFNGYQTTYRINGQPVVITGMTIRPSNLWFDALKIKTTLPGSGDLFSLQHKHSDIRRHIQKMALEKPDEVVSFSAKEK